MRQPMDAIRSVQKHVYGALGEPWEVRLRRDERGPGRPLAILQRSGPLATGTGRHVYVCTLPVAGYFWPVPGESPAESEFIAMGVEAELQRVFRQQSGGRFPLRIPLYDFEGVPFSEQPVESSRHRSDFMQVNETGPATNVVQDEDDELLYTVTCEIRVSWTATSDVPSDASLVGSISFDREALS